MSATDTGTAPKDLAYAERLSQALDAHPRAPDARGRQAWVMTELANVGVRVSRETISRWFSGDVKPRVDKNEKIAQFLGVDPLWLYHGKEPFRPQREQKLRNAEADGLVNVIAGFVQMDGGHPAFPEAGDRRAQRDSVDLYAIIRGANYALHVVGAEETEHDTWRFVIPEAHEHVVVLGVIRQGFNIRVIELSPELIEAHGTAQKRTIFVELDDKTVLANQLKSFANRL